MSQWWVRQRIEGGVLPAAALTSGQRVIYRIRSDDWTAFCARHAGDARDRLLR